MHEENSSGVGPEKRAPSTAKPKAWVKVLLVVSLGINLLIVGLIFGAFLHGRDILHERGTIPPEARIMREMGLGPFLGAFPPEQRRQLGRSLREHIGSNQVNRADLAAELAKILQTIRADPYEHSALAAVFDRQKTRIADRAAVGRDVLLEAILAMSTEERATFASRMQRSMQRDLENFRRDRP